MTRAYAGVGSRKTPGDVLRTMRRLSARLSVLGWVLRTGGADGADAAFLTGVWDVCPHDGGVPPELYLPWEGFNGANLATSDHPSFTAYAIASKHHPAWGSLSDAARALHARNVHQILGRNCSDPSKFVVCWTEDGACTEQPPTRETGGTGQAIRIAIAYDVPIFNLARQDALERVKAFL